MLNVIGKKSLVPAVSTIGGAVFAAIAAPLSVNVFGAAGGSYYVYPIFAVFYVALAYILIYNGYFLITLPRDIILFDGDSGEVTVYTSRRKKVCFNASDIKLIRRVRPIISMRRLTAHLTFESADGKRITARFITDPDAVMYALNKK